MMWQQTLHGDLSGYCEHNDPIYRTMLTVRELEAVVLFNKVVQIAFFIVYFYYWHTEELCLLPINKPIKSYICVFGMGATISISPAYNYISN